MRIPDVSRRVVIVGAGLAGTATAVRLLQFAREPLQVVLVEQRPEHRSAGVAYHREGNPWHHVFNIQAGRMSMFREDVDDFVAWANTEADRADWPPEWSGVTFTESGPAPRRVYADYLADRLADAAREAADGVTLLEVDGEVVDVTGDGGRAQVFIDTEDSQVTLDADHVVIATGLQERDLPFATGVMDHPAFVRHPYSESGVERILGVGPDAVVVIVGSLLSAYDSAALLLRRGHTGEIYMISRSGLTLRTYPSDHRHQVLSLPAPQLRNDGYEGREDLVRLLRDEWERACAIVAREHPDVAQAVVTERVAKSWEPYLPEVLARVPSADLRALLDSHTSLLATLRVGAVAYTTEIVDAALRDDGGITLVTGKVDRIAETADGRLTVSVAGSTPIDAGLVIANFGREPDYERVRSVLWQNLLRGKTAVPHRRTGRGVEVDEAGALLGPDGVASGPVSVVGGPREGDEIVRYGRLGAFSFNLAAIKNHSVGVAATILCRLESCYDDQADVASALADSPDETVRAAFTSSVALDVHRMAARHNHTRQALARLLEESLAAVHDAMPVPMTAAALRYAVNTVAVTRLNDLSVTPRDLRSELGLEIPGP